MTYDSKSFSADMPSAEKLFSFAKGWGDNDIDKVQLAIALCQPQAAKKGTYKKVFGEISSNLSKAKKRAAEISQVQPLLHAVAVTFGTNKIYIDFLMI